MQTTQQYTALSGLFLSVTDDQDGFAVSLSAELSPAAFVGQFADSARPPTGGYIAPELREAIHARLREEALALLVEARSRLRLGLLQATCAVLQEDQVAAFDRIFITGGQA